MTFPSRKKNHIAEREAQILRVAGEILASEGPNGLTMERVLARLDFSKGTLYSHFTCREDLLVAFQAQCYTEHYEFFARGALFRGRPRERFLATGIGSEIRHRLDPVRFSPCTIDISVSAASERWRDAHAACLRENVGVFTGIVRDGIASGDLPSNADPELIASSTWSLWIGAEHLYRSGMIFRDQEFDEFQLARDSMLATLLDGYQWQPLSSVHDYEEVRRRILTEVFRPETEKLSIPLERRIP
ncbi:MAG: TetR/AcrR family transcriptional regulator, partial [Opitutaceae bacterium]